MRNSLVLMAAVGFIALPPLVSAGIIVYPANGQSTEQQKKDEGECLTWAKEQSGFDPTAPLETTAPPPQTQAPTTSAGRGMLRGALAGVAIGAIAGDAGKGAAIGAGTGLLVGGARQREQVNSAYAQQDAWANEQAAQYEQRQSDFNRAYGVCLQGRGYTVSQ